MKILGVIALVFLVLLGVGYYGFFLAYPAGTQSFWDLVYLSLQLFVLQSGAEVPVNNPALQAARFLAPILTVSAFALVIVIFFEQVQKFRIRSMNDHQVICGLGYLGLEIARISAASKNVIVIEKDQNNPNVRVIRDLGVPIIIGDATQEHLLNMVRIGRARDIYMVTGNDSINAEIAAKCYDILERSGKNQLCGHVHFENRDLWQAFGTCSSQGATTTGCNPQQMEFFNLYQIAGFCMLIKHKPFTYDEIQAGSVNILIVGLGRLGENLLARIVKRWKYSEHGGKKIRITCIDREGERKRQALFWKYPDISTWCDLRILSLDVTSPEFLQSEVLSDNSGLTPYSRVFICYHNSSLSTLTALRLANHARFRAASIIVRATYSDGITSIFECLKKLNSLQNIEIFPIVSNPCCLDMIVHGGSILEENYMREEMARVIHENYRTMRFKEGAVRGTDPALEPWDNLPQYLKDSNYGQADHIREKLRTMNLGITLLPDWDEPLFQFEPEEIDFLAELEHKRWMTQKIAAGWNYGPDKNEQLKEHNCLVDYDKLPEKMKNYDREPVANIPAILARFDLKIYRLPPWRKEQ